MFIKYRPIRLQDLDECQHCIRDGFLYDERSRAQLVDMWRELLIQQSACAAVMEDLLAPVGQRIIWFCIKVFISEDYATYLKTNAPPFVGRQIVGSWLKGQSPVLTAAQIRRANSGGGLTMLVLNSGAPCRMLTPENVTTITNEILEFTRYFSSRYRCNEFLAEYYDDFTCNWAACAGFHLRTDYLDYFVERNITPPRDQHPRLYGTTPFEAQTHLGTLAASILQYQSPRFFFRPSEQQLLFHALLGDTDREVADTLGLALVTIRKRWDSIYERVASVRPDLFTTQEDEILDSKRGMEKKRYLLTYLRHHLEELRPLEARAA